MQGCFFVIPECRFSPNTAQLMCKNCPEIMVFPGYLLFHLIVSKLFPLQNLALSFSLNVLQKILKSVDNRAYPENTNFETH